MHFRLPYFTARAVALALLALPCRLAAEPLVSVDTVVVGDAGNASDASGFGAVSYPYRIGKYEVTIGQYATFLNSVASLAASGHLSSLWADAMQTNLNTAGIRRSGGGTTSDPYLYSVIGPFGTPYPGASSPSNRPIAYVSWFDAARFCNWLHNGATNGASTETGAYTLNGATNGNAPARNPGAKWWIPTENEWFKAAFYKGGGTDAGYWSYPTASDTLPGNSVGASSNQANHAFNQRRYSVTQSSASNVSQNYLTDVGAYSNSASAYGTFDQCGNVWEWNDLDAASGPTRGMRGAAWYNTQTPSNASKTAEREDAIELPELQSGTGGWGFRVAGAIPPPEINSPLNASGRVGRSFSYQVTATGSPATFRAAELPSGLSIDASSGLISGKPRKAGNFDVVISANNAGSGTGSAKLMLSIAKGTQTIKFDLAKSKKFKKNGTFTLTATATSKLRVSFKSSNEKILSIRGRTATMHRAGEVTVTASQRGDANYSRAREVQCPVVIK